MTHFSWAAGVLAIRLWGYIFILKAPWAFAYFSERHGYVKWRQLGLGWRFHFSRLRK